MVPWGGRGAPRPPYDAPMEPNDETFDDVHEASGELMQRLLAIPHVT